MTRPDGEPVRLPDDAVAPYDGRLLLRDDGIRFFRRWADGIRAEFTRAARRRRFFHDWQPEGGHA